MNILNQRDIRWKDKTINETTSTIGNYGCTLTCLAMLADTTPDIVESKLEFSVDRIIWTSINKTDLPIRFPDMGRAYSYDNDKVKQAIEKNGGCLVEVDFDGVISTPNDRHWVLFIGDGKAYDPWTGTEISTTKYSILKGYCLIDKIQSSIINDMPDVISELIKTNGLTEGDIRWLVDLKANQTVSNLEKQVSDLQEKIHEYEIDIQSLLAEITQYQEEIVVKQSEIDSANIQIKTLEGDLQTMTDEKNKFKGYYETALKDQVNKYTGWQLISLGIKKLLSVKK